MNNIKLIVLLLTLLPCVLIIVNLFFYKKPEIANDITKPPLVSILIPARNEAENIAKSIKAALASEHSYLEVIVLDDHSTDKTPEIVKEIAGGDSRLRLIFSKPLPDDWCGKQHACYQLAQQARGKILLFISYFE